MGRAAMIAKGGLASWLTWTRSSGAVLRSTQASMASSKSTWLGSATPSTLLTPFPPWLEPGLT